MEEKRFLVCACVRIQLHCSLAQTKFKLHHMCASVRVYIFIRVHRSHCTHRSQLLPFKVVKIWFDFWVITIFTSHSSSIPTYGCVCWVIFLCLFWNSYLFYCIFVPPQIEMRAHVRDRLSSFDTYEIVYKVTQTQLH